MKVKVATASGPVLDWMVAKCEGDEPVFRLHKHSKGATIYRNEGLRQGGIDFRPSIVWAQGGPIIEREKISVNPAVLPCSDWVADTFKVNEKTHNHGPTPLIAAMRCLVASKLGEEVEVPSELVS